MANISLNLAVKKVSSKLCVDQQTVEMVYKSYWGFIKNHISGIDLQSITEEELANTITNFNIPYIGKLYVTYDKIQKHKNQTKFYQNVKAKKNKTNRKPDTD